MRSRGLAPRLYGAVVPTGCVLACLVVGSGCVYAWDKDPIALEEGDVTGVLVGVPPGEILEVSRGLRGGRVRVEKSVLVRSSNADGRFVVRNLSEGTHVMSMTYDPNHDGVPDLARQLRVPIRIPSGQSKRPYVNMGDIVLLPPGTIQGRVESPDGLAGIAVVLASSEYHTTVNSENGQFEIRGVGEGDWDLVAAGAKAMSPSRRVHVPSGGVVVLEEPLRLERVTATGTVQAEIQEGSVGKSVMTHALHQALGAVQSTSLLPMVAGAAPITDPSGSTSLFLTAPAGI